MSESTTTSWSSNLSGYLKRASPYPDPPESFVPKRPDLELVFLRSSKVEHAGINLVIYDGGIAIDATGKISILTEKDYKGIYDLARRTKRLPKSRDFRSQWRVKHETTGHPIDRILVSLRKLENLPAESYDDEYLETSVYGFDKDLKELEKPIGTFNEVPPQLFELAGLALEAREGADGPRDEAVLRKCRVTFGNVF